MDCASIAERGSLVLEFVVLICHMCLHNETYRTDASADSQVTP